MADRIVPLTAINSAPTQDDVSKRNIDFATIWPFYQLHPDAKKTDVQDQLSARLAQLTSMLQMIHGNGFENFESWSDEIKHNYLWGCSMLAEECKSLGRHL